MEDKLANLKSYLYAARVDNYQRVGHRVIQIGHYILVFGGTNSQNQYITTVLRINTQSIIVDPMLINTQLKIEEFSLFSFNQSIYLWGGNEPSGPSNKLYKFQGNEFELAAQSGQIPSPRSHHTSFLFSKRYLIIHGGMDTKQFFNDFYILDCSTMTWSKVITNIQLPLSISHIFWSGGRGFLVTTENFNPITKRDSYQMNIYELRLTDSKQFKMNLDLITVTQSAMKKNQNKKDPTIILVNLESPYLMVIGGEVQPTSTEETESYLYKDIWIFNIQTLEWTASNTKLLSSGFGFQAVFFQERLYLIGGVSINYRQLTNTIEVIDINSDCLQAKLCKVCREVYGIREYIGFSKQFAIKFEYQQKQRTFFSVGTIAKLAKFVRFPFSAIGLLIDNSFNLNGTLITIELKYFDREREQSQQRNSFQQAGSLLDKIDNNRLKMKYNYIKITDDTCGFTQSQIIECLCAFGIKTEKLTTDKKYEEQLEIRRQYGVNIKLGAMRLAQSCLYVAKTEDDTIFISYFSTIEKNVGNKFQIFSYFINEQGRSSQINYEIIKKNVYPYLPTDYQRLDGSERTKIYLFNLQYQQMVKQLVSFNDFDITFRSSTTRSFQKLRVYLQSLYFIPYNGRTIKLEGSPIKFINYPELFKKQEQQKIITKININIPQSMIKKIGLFHYHNPKYPMKEILVYHQNRLIFSVDMSQRASICGYMVIPSTISVDLCKNRIESHEDEFNFHKFMNKLVNGCRSRFPPGEYSSAPVRPIRE